MGVFTPLPSLPPAPRLAVSCWHAAAVLLWLFALAMLPPSSASAQTGYGKCDTPSDVYVWPLGDQNCYNASTGSTAIWDPERADWGYGAVFPPPGYSGIRFGNSRTVSYDTLSPYMEVPYGFNVESCKKTGNVNSCSGEAGSCHAGTDLRCAITPNTAVYAIGNGRIIYSRTNMGPGCHSNCGRTLVLEFWHERKQQYCYARYRFLEPLLEESGTGAGYCFDSRKGMQSGPQIRAGSHVCAGDVLGTVMSDWNIFSEKGGNTTPHLGIEISCDSTLASSQVFDIKTRMIDPRLSERPYPGHAQPDDQLESCYGNARTANEVGFRYGAATCCPWTRDFYEDPRNLLLRERLPSIPLEQEGAFNNRCLLIAGGGPAPDASSYNCNNSVSVPDNLHNCNQYLDSNNPGMPPDNSHRDQCADDEIAGSKSLSCIRRKRTPVLAPFWNDAVSANSADLLSYRLYAETGARNTRAPASTGASAAFHTESAIDRNEPSRVLLSQDDRYGPENMEMDCLALQPLNNNPFSFPFRFTGLPNASQLTEVRDRLNYCTNEYIFTSNSTANPVDLQGSIGGLSAELCQPLRIVALNTREEIFADRGLRSWAVRQAYTHLAGQGRRWVPGTYLGKDASIAQAPENVSGLVQNNYTWWEEDKYAYPRTIDEDDNITAYGPGTWDETASVTTLMNSELYPYERIYDPSHPFSPRHFTLFDSNGEVLTDRSYRFNMNNADGIGGWNITNETPACANPSFCQTRCDPEVMVDIMGGDESATETSRIIGWAGAEARTSIPERVSSTGCMNPRWARNRMLRPDGNPRRIAPDTADQYRTGWGGTDDLRYVPNPNVINACWDTYVRCMPWCGDENNIPPTPPAGVCVADPIDPADIPYPPANELPPICFWAPQSLGCLNFVEQWQENWVLEQQQAQIDACIANWRENWTMDCRRDCAMTRNPQNAQGFKQANGFPGWIECATSAPPWWDTANELPCAIQVVSSEPGPNVCQPPQKSTADRSTNRDNYQGDRETGFFFAPKTPLGIANHLSPVQQYNQTPPLMQTSSANVHLETQTQNCSVACSKKCLKSEGDSSAFQNCHESCTTALNCKDSGVRSYSCTGCFQACGENESNPADLKNCMNECQSAICGTLYGESCADCVHGCLYEQSNPNSCVQRCFAEGGACINSSSACREGMQTIFDDAADIRESFQLNCSHAAASAVRSCNYDAVDDLSTVPLRDVERVRTMWEEDDYFWARQFTNIFPSHFFDDSPVAMKCNIFLPSVVGGWGDGSDILSDLKIAPLPPFTSDTIEDRRRWMRPADAMVRVEHFINMYPEALLVDDEMTKVDTIQECCNRIARPLPMTNVLKVRHRQIAWPDRNAPGGYNAPEGYTFEEYFGDHRPYMRWWDTGKEAGAAVPDHVNPARDGMYDAIVGVGIEGQQCGYGGWRTTHMYADGTRIPGIESSNPGYILPDPNSSWAELKLWQARSYRHFHLRCLARNDRTFKVNSPEDYVLYKAGGEYSQKVGYVPTDSETGDFTNVPIYEPDVTIEEGIPILNSYTVNTSINVPRYLIRTVTQPAPLSWRGYVSEPFNGWRTDGIGNYITPKAGHGFSFPFYNRWFGNEPENITFLESNNFLFDNVITLDNARAGDILMWDSTAPNWNWPALPHVAYVSEASNLAGCTATCQQSTETKNNICVASCGANGSCITLCNANYNNTLNACATDCEAEFGPEGSLTSNATSPAYLIIEEHNYGKFPDVCGYTQNWGLNTKRTLYRPTQDFLPQSLPSAPPGPTATLTDAYQSLYPNSYEQHWDCTNPDNKECVEMNWGSSNSATRIRIYRPRYDETPTPAP